MIQIGVATVHFRYPRLSDKQLRILAGELFETAEIGSRDFLRIPGIDPILELEEASLRARTKLFASAAGVATFLNFYGGIREGGEYLARDVLSAATYIIEAVPERAGVSPDDVITSRRSPTLSRRIESLFRKVQHGQLNPERATEQLLRLLDPDNEGVISEPLEEQIRDEVSSVFGYAVNPPIHVSVKRQEMLPFPEPNDFDPLAAERPEEHPKPGRRLRVWRERGSLVIDDEV